jgi:hypothetical protein
MIAGFDGARGGNWQSKQSSVKNMELRGSDVRGKSGVSNIIVQEKISKTQTRELGAEDIPINDSSSQSFSTISIKCLTIAMHLLFYNRTQVPS